MRWILLVVAAVAAAFLYFRWISGLSSVIESVSTLAPRQHAPATSLAASPPNAPANVSSELPLSASLAIAPTPGDNRQETKGSDPRNQVAQAQIGSTPTTSTEVESGKKQLMELLEVARAELANSGAGDTTSTAGKANFQQFEAQIKAAMEAIDAKPAQIDQQAGAVAPEKPDRGARHRRRR